MVNCPYLIIHDRASCGTTLLLMNRTFRRRSTVPFCDYFLGRLGRSQNVAAMPSERSCQDRAVCCGCTGCCCGGVCFIVIVFWLLILCSWCLVHHLAIRTNVRVGWFGCLLRQSEAGRNLLNIGNLLSQLVEQLTCRAQPAARLGRMHDLELPVDARASNNAISACTLAALASGRSMIRVCPRRCSLTNQVDHYSWTQFNSGQSHLMIRDRVSK